MDRHCDNARGVAKFLNDHDKASWVNFTEFEDNKYYALSNKYLPKGAGSILSFGVKGGAEAGAKFIEAAQFFEPFGECWRCQDIDHPPGFDHSPTA